jgi:hypothetical protein
MKALALQKQAIGNYTHPNIPFLKITQASAALEPSKLNEQRAIRQASGSLKSPSSTRLTFQN